MVSLSSFFLVVVCTMMMLFCVSSSHAQKAMPTFADSFSLHMEVNQEFSNVTMFVEEHFDFSADRAHIRVETIPATDVYIDGAGETEYIVNGGVCTTKPLLSDPRLGNVEDPETHHLRRPSDLFRFKGVGDGTVTGLTYTGWAKARGIDCDTWTGTWNTKTDNFKIDGSVKYFWTQNQWRSAFSKENTPHPVRLQISGTAYNGTKQADGTVVYSDKGVNIVSHMEIINFLAGSPPTALINPPQLCSQPSKPLPVLPDSFSATIEANIKNKKYSLEVQEVTDYQNNREYHRTVKHEHVVHVVDDLNAKKRYTWTGSSCESTDISPQVIARMGQQGHIKKTKDFLRLTRSLNYTYEGFKEIRGIAGESWAAKDTTTFTNPRTGSAYRMESNMVWTFATAQWTVSHNSTTHQVPLALELTGKSYIDNALNHTFDHTYHFVGFDHTIDEEMYLFAQFGACDSSPGPGASGLGSGNGNGNGLGNGSENGDENAEGPDAVTVGIIAVCVGLIAGVLVGLFSYSCYAKRAGWFRLEDPAPEGSANAL